MKHVSLKHFTLPALVALAIVGLGVCVPAVSQADTTSCTGLSGVFQTSTTTTTTRYNADQQGGSAPYHCVQYIQQMINGALAYDWLKADGTATLNSKPVSSVTTFGTAAGGFGKVSGTYDARTTSFEASFQRFVNAGPTSLSSTTATPNGKLRTDGATDKNTLLALCTVAYNLPVSVRMVTNSTDFTGGAPNSSASNKTNMWYMRSYMRTGYTAASDAGCASLLGSKTTVVATQPPSEPTSVSNATTTNKLTVTWPAVSGATSYNVQILSTTGQTLLHRATVKATTHAVFSVATSGATGTTEVQACNTVGCSLWRWQSTPFKF